MNLRKYLGNEKGFTMVEMMVVLIIIAVLIGTGISFYTGYIGKAKVTKAKAEISTMQAALDAHYAEEDKYPATDLGAAGIATDLIIATAGQDGSVKYNYKAFEENNNSNF